MVMRTMSSELHAAKATLRLALKKRLSAMPEECRLLETESVVAQLVRTEAYKNATNISTYLSMREEVGTENLLVHAFSAGKKVFIPRYSGQKMDMLSLRSMEDYSSLPLTKWNIKQPSYTDTTRENALDIGLDVVIIPGLGFTRNGKRIGRGKGYYDAFLAECRARLPKKPFTIALAFECQLVNDEPDHDQPFPFDDKSDELIDLVLYPGLK